MGSQATTKSTLREIQEWMAELILDPALLTAGEAAQSSLRAVVTAPDAVTAATRVAIHTDGYPARVHEALLEAYPTVQHVVGDEPFIALVYRLLPELPKETYNLNEIGRIVPAFLRDDRTTDDLPFLPDLADLEWKIVEAFHAPMLNPFDLSQCADWSLDDWQSAVFSFQPSASLVCSSWPIREIREARETPVDKIDIDLRDRPDRVLVYRRGFNVKSESLSENEARAIGQLMAGDSLGNTLEALASHQSDQAEVMTWFSRWMGLKLIVGIGS